MRIISGKWRGRALLAPPGEATRPTADRAREALFSMLTSRLGSFEELRVADIFAGYYETTLGNDELIAEIEVPVRRGWRSHYVKVATRAAHDWPALGLTVSAQFESRTIADLRLVLSAAVDRPVRLTAAEAALRGADVGDAVLHHAGEAAASEVDIESDHRGSADYKRHLLRVHLGRAIKALAAE